MLHIRRFVALTSVALISSCATNSSGTSVPQTLQQTSVRGTLTVDKESGLRAPVPEGTFSPGEVNVAPGFADVSPHQLVRTSQNLLYVAVPACISYPTCLGNTLKMEAGNRTGNPTAYSERDAAHHPASPTTTNDAIGSSAIAIDGNGVIWVAYNTRNYGTHAISFDTKTNLWGHDYRLGTLSAGTYDVTQGREGVAMAVDKSGEPHVVFNVIGADNAKHIEMAHEQGGTWSTPVQIDDAGLGAGQSALHPTMAFTPANRLLVTWLTGNENKAYNTPDGKIHVRDVTEYPNPLHSIEIPDPVVAPNTGYAATTIDQGPSLLVTADGVAHLTYLDTNDYIRYWFSNGTNYQSWNGDRQPARQQTHDPSLGPDGGGGLYIYGHGTPMNNLNGHGNNLYRMRLANAATAWTPFVLQIDDNDVDCSVSTRWAQFFNYFPTQIDYLYWHDNYPNEAVVTNH